MYKKLYLFILSFILLFTTTVNAYAITVPEPDSNLVYVQDFAHVLENDTVQHILEYNKKLDNATGAQIVIVTVNTINNTDIEDYAYEIFNTYGIGSSSKNNGVLLLLAIVEDNYYMMSGSGLERHFTGGISKQFLLNYLEDDFAVGDYDSGVKKWFDAIYEDLTVYYQNDINQNNNPPVKVDEYDSILSSIITSFLTILLLLIILVVILSITSSRRRTSSYRQSTFFTPRIQRRSTPFFLFRTPRSSTRSWSSSNRSNYRSSSFTRRSSSTNRSFSSNRSSSSRSSFGGGKSRGGGAGRK